MYLNIFYKSRRSNHDQNSYNDQKMIKIHTMIERWSKFIQWSKHDQNSYNGQIRPINIFKYQKVYLKNWLEYNFMMK